MKPVAELKDRLKEALDIRKKKAADLAKDLDIPKSAISQYLSGSSKKMDSIRMYQICVYLDVAEAWLMGADVPMERPKMNKATPEEAKKSDANADITDRILKDEDFRNLVLMLNKLDEKQLVDAQTLLKLSFKNTFNKDEK